jgi:hypothetical protein
MLVATTEKDFPVLQNSLRKKTPSGPPKTLGTENGFKGISTHL